MRATVLFVLCVFAVASTATAQTSIATVPSADGTPVASSAPERARRSSLSTAAPATAPDGRRYFLCSRHIFACARWIGGRTARAAIRLPYRLLQEIEDVVAVVEAQRGPVFVLGHSFGAVCAFEAAFHTAKIEKLAPVQPPVLLSDHSGTLARMEELIRSGDREGALMVFMRDIVMISEDELRAMKSRPSWTGLLATVELSNASGPCAVAVPIRSRPRTHVECSDPVDAGQ